MSKVRITAVRQTVYTDLMAQYENPISHACDVSLGQQWVSVDGRCPEGMCPSAWSSMREFVESLARGEGNFYDGWMKNPMSAMISCNDGFRPVSFYIERIEERELSMMAMSFLGEHDILNTLHQDYIAKYAYNLGISRHQAVLMLKGNRKYPENIFMAKLSHFYDEKDCMYQMQYKCKMFMFGADHIYTLTNF